MSSDYIVIKGAKEHNLQNINLKLLRDTFIVITGLSGSGKSSLAFDTIYAEGQRRYVESLSAYARQFLGVLEKPDVESIEGLSPAISIEQKSTHKNPRSIVSTITEIYDYFRLLFARVGIPHCPNCGNKITSQTSSQIIDDILNLPDRSKLIIISPLVTGQKGEYKNLISQIKKDGFVRVRIDNKIYNLNTDTIPKLDKNIRHSIELVVDRLILKKGIRSRLADSVELALHYSGGLVIISTDNGEKIYSQKLACIKCGVSVPEISPRLFSFNSPYGACPECSGLGKKLEIDPELVIPDKNLSILEGAIAPYRTTNSNYFMSSFYALAKKYNFSLDTPFKNLPAKIQNIILYGTGDAEIEFEIYSDRFQGAYKGRYEGVINNLSRRYKETKSEYIRQEIGKYLTDKKCPVCNGQRLKPEALAVKINNYSIMDITKLSVNKAYSLFENLKFSKQELVIAKDILKEIKQRLKFLIDVGLGYLTLDRESGTLSGGEAQRIRLATQVGAGLVGVLYVLDEPSIGLHQRDNKRLLNTLRKLQQLGNTLIVVEHDEETIRNADYIVDLGPGAGEYGGKIVAQGTPEEIINNKNSLTGRYLKGDLKIKIPERRRKGNGKFLTVYGAALHNLKNIDVKFPLGKFICITGVSGSGKSTLLTDIIYPELARRLNKAIKRGGKHKKITGVEYLDKVIDIDQSPIGRTPRSNPATYTGVFTYIRELFSNLPESKIKGYAPGRFSFNVRGGRCEKCEGQGIIKIEMHFLPDVYIKCEACNGMRFNKETLEIKYKNKSISDVLNMSVDTALDFFKNIPGIKNKLQTLNEVGLGYIKLGQPATTLSGGEAQRVKLAAELSKRSTGKTLYILDEPTTGLHFDDINKLLNILNKFVDNGNTVIVIEHNLDVIKVADWIIDLGPEGGDEGGTIVAEGTPEDIIRNKKSYTGRFLKKVMS